MTELLTSNLATIVGFFNRKEKEDESERPIQSLGLVFKLHTHVTFIILVLSSSLLQFINFSGGVIHCRSGTAESLSSAASQHCWTNGTFILRSSSSWINNTGLEGLGFDTECDDASCGFWLGYYQWTAMLLLLQAFLFYVPRWLWSQVEEGVLGSMVKSFREIKEINTKTKRDLEALCEDLVSNKGHIALLFKYRVFLDVLNFGITLSQIYFLDWVLGEFSILSPDQQRLNRMSFLKFGCGLIEYAIFGKWGQLGLNTPPGASLFPRRSKCNFVLVGSGGGLRREQFLCFLFLNNVNEKVFGLLWFWLHPLLLVGGITAVASLAKANSWTWSLMRQRPKKRSKVPKEMEFVLDLVKVNASPSVASEARSKLEVIFGAKAL